MGTALEKEPVFQGDDPLSDLAQAGAGAPDYELIELMFFAYRDLVGDADHLLENFGLGRAHHRVLHFVNRRPGLTIAELLDILKITKQSLNRVLKDLLDRSYVVACPGENDRRQRLLFPTRRGEALALDAARVQSGRFARVLAKLPHGARAKARAFLLAIIDEGERDKVAALVAAARPPQVRD
ncbi:MAG: MarR family winged helix-turn-helix transcriptional regulator [Methylocella sp.]